MKVKKILSLLLAVLLVASAVVIATAEEATPAVGEAVTQDAENAVQTAETTAEEAAPAVTYTMDEMMTMAMADAYARQAAYAAYAEAFPDSRSIGSIDMDTQIVLLEMLLKANGVALPANTESVTAPATQTEAYQAIAAAEGDALTMYRSFLEQESLAADANLVFRSVAQSVRSNAVTFARKAQSAVRAEQWEAQWQEIMNSDKTKVYTMDDRNGRGTWTVYVYNSNSTDEAAGTTDTTTETVEDAVTN